ncbi:MULTISPECIES: MarR family winged helix-turn-helix transcriptional regulator [unclassified Sphingobium]|uniref:MarR family winged helix-turn-helix transcriptional regulator n=1 Tax=unclassified Sphingobium TaxID=2611147 RepID=UPI0015EBE550|nr:MULTISPECIES: MarR family transcriptional regulator [unclassified Sphingobium]MCW2362179.1 DNA-binding MarR family transcriptional regulator [Sphingobium sp. B10D3B]MCW2401142.1 DNA-binding MarR family transcriptional regulator [Sphingobium sp. B10D7B]MCW2408122.1 DNA-binding MarR family transcriptional regulator [Sphingobium xanthum]
MRVFLRKPGFLLNRIDQIANALYGSVACGGETLSQAEMMLAIAERPGSDQVRLARACGSDTSTTAIVLQNLELTGLIARQQDERDRRRSLPVLTAAGEARMDEIRSSFAQLQALLLDPLSDDERAVAMAQLSSLVEAGNDGAPRWDRQDSYLANVPSMLFRRALQILHAHFSEQVAPMAVTLRQFSAMVILDLHGGLSQVEFARVYGLDPSTCAIVLKKLAQRGWLQAVPSPQDRRKTLYFVTDEGRHQIDRLQASADATEDAVRSNISARAFEALLPPLQSVVRAHSAILRYPGFFPWDNETPQSC